MNIEFCEFYLDKLEVGPVELRAAFLMLKPDAVDFIGIHKLIKAYNYALYLFNNFEVAPKKCVLKTSSEFGLRYGLRVTLFVSDREYSTLEFSHPRGWEMPIFNSYTILTSNDLDVAWREVGRVL